MGQINEKSNKGIAGIRVIQTNFWLKRILAFERGQSQIIKLNKNSEFVAGLMLYWGEGSKSLGTEISNSDVNLIVFMVRWFGKFYGITPKSLVVQMHIHSGQNPQNLRQYWSRVTRIPISNFQQHYVKPQGSGHRKKKIYKGTVKIRVRGIGSTYLLYQILGAIAEYNNRVLGVKVDIRKWIHKPIHAK